MKVDVFIKKIAKKAGDAVWKRFGKDGVHYMKSEFAFDVVTKADLMADKMIVTAIRKAFPSHGINAEESGWYNKDAEYIWHIDPIDGTKNFAKHIPLFGTMIALSRGGKVILSAVYLPVNKELFFAKVGKGAFLNGKRIHCSTKKDFKKTEGFCQLEFAPRNAKFLRNLLALKNTNHLYVATYNCFAANGCYAAAGRKDWVVAPYGAMHDFPAPVLILQEAGCRVTDLKGKPWTLDSLEAVAANPTLHRELIKLTKSV